LQCNTGSPIRAFTKLEKSQGLPNQEFDNLGRLPDIQPDIQTGVQGKIASPYLRDRVVGISRIAFELLETTYNKP
jgi:hypothetical protein